MSLRPKTLAEVIAALFGVPSLADRTRSDLASAVRCFCRVTGLDPQITHAGDLAALQATLVAATPERFGIAANRWSVIRSQLLRALVLTGAAKPLQTATTRLTPGWDALIGGALKVRHRLALSRFARFCVQQGIAPGAVTEETFEAYREALAGGSLVRNPDGVYREAVLAWAELPDGTSGRSAAPVTVPLPPAAAPAGRHPLSGFPESFRADLEAFQHWCRTADPLDDAARPKALRPQTVISYTSNIHTAADAAVRGGVAIADITSLAVLARPDVYTRILRCLLADSQQQATANLHNVATMVPILAQGWLRQSPEQIAVLKKIKAKLPKLRPGLTPKNRAFLATFEDKSLLGRFLRLGDVLWKEALADTLPRNQRLVRSQMALLIGMLQITPLRRKNICSLVFDQHITWPNGGNAEALIQVPSPEGKTEFDYLGELPLDLSRRLHHYRTRLAPALTGAMPTHLFIKADGRPKRPASVVNRLVYTLGRRLGIHMTPHQFRHLCGKLMLDDNPGAYEAVAQLLGHAGTRNVLRFYGGVDTRRAVRHHTKLIEKLREEGRQRGTRRRKT
jgi:integrase